MHPAVPPDPKGLVVLVSTPSAEVARSIGRALVEDRLAACAQVLPAMRSIYRWQDEVSEDDENLLILKTRRDRFAPLRQRVVELHPYDVPQIVAVSIAEAHAPYLEWLLSATEPQAPPRPSDSGSR